MLYRIEITTTEQVTIERESAEEAEAYARKMEREANEHHHHGEKTTVRAVHVPYAK